MPELKKVVQVMRRFVPGRWGGTESVVFNVSRELVRQGIESPVHCTAMFAAAGPERMDGVPVHRHRYCFPWFGLSPGAKEALRLKGGSPLSLPLFLALLREKNVSLIHTHVQHRLGGMARTAARLRSVPYVVSLHGGFFTLPQAQVDQMTRPFAGRPEWGKVFGALFGSRRVLADADAIVCVGRDEFDEVRKRYPDKPVFLMPNGVEVARFSGADGTLFREAFGYRPEEKIVLCVSRIDYQKNQLGLVRAFARFARQHRDHRLVLLGPVAFADYHDQVVAEIGRLGMADRIRIIEGFRPDDPRLPSAYKAADLFVLPSVHEPFGIVVLEAWAAGVPVLASRVGGVPDFATDRETALLVEPGCEDQLVAGMETLAADASLCDRLVSKARSIVAQQYDWTVVAARMRAVYEELVTKR